MPKVLPAPGDFIEIDIYHRALEIVGQDTASPEMLIAKDDAGNEYPIFLSYLYEYPNSWKFKEETGNIMCPMDASDPDFRGIDPVDLPSPCDHAYLSWTGIYGTKEYCSKCGINKE